MVVRPIERDARQKIFERERERDGDSEGAVWVWCESRAGSSLIRSGVELEIDVGG